MDGTGGGGEDVDMGPRGCPQAGGPRVRRCLEESETLPPGEDSRAVGSVSSKALKLGGV